MTPNYYGCITQLDQRGGGVGYRDKVLAGGGKLADASMAAVGGWDIRPTKPGDALLEAQILDYDLVRQVKSEMNKVKIFRGVYDERFIGTSQHATATHILKNEEAPTDAERLKCIRADIRYFKWRNGVVGHTTVIWSASVEPNSELILQYQTAEQLIQAIELSEQDRGGPLPPSLIYATAALLEGCSFMNGGSQNTISCPGLVDLAQRQLGVYCLGTDYKAGQTKFKTAAVEYIRTMGLKPKVIASSNHLGNNDMRNLASAKSASTAKLRVKHDIFAPWEEDELDHKVSIMFTEFINDEKRDFVEYTSLGFLGQTHTMVTYTRASDSVLCVPLMIDGAVWCDFFSSYSWSYDKVAKALAYLFKVPEGAAKGVDPGFFRQMEELNSQVMSACKSRNSSRSNKDFQKKRVRIRAEEKAAEWAIPADARVMCAGLACVDMQLNHATGGDGGENIETFQGEKSIGGGSVSMACKTLARLCHGEPLDDEFMEVTPPVVHSVVPICKIGNDDTGDKLLSLLEKCGTACRNVETKCAKSMRDRDPSARTALSVLPIYTDGRRGCFFDAASNITFSEHEVIAGIRSATSIGTDVSMPFADDLDPNDISFERPAYGAFLFGYPHLLPKLQGASLESVFVEAKSVMLDGGIIVLDLNGVPKKQSSNGISFQELKEDRVLGPCLHRVDILHLNQDELSLVTGCKYGNDEISDRSTIQNACNLFLRTGVAIVVLTRGKKGSYVVCSDRSRFERSPMLPRSWIDCAAWVDATELSPGTVINSNGAGDAFTAGFLVATLLRHTGMTVPPRTPSKDRNHESSTELRDISSPKGSPRIPRKKLTGYTMYIQEKYSARKVNPVDDKTVVFAKCHEMWEGEADEVKALYERMAEEENEMEKDLGDKPSEQVSIDDTSKADISDLGESIPRNMFMANKTLTLESAVKFASVVAAFHIDVGNRDRLHIDVNEILARSMDFQPDFKEI